METLSSLLALCAGTSPVTGEFPPQRPVARSFDVFYLRLNKWLSKQSRRWSFETPSRSFWRQYNALAAVSSVHNVCEEDLNYSLNDIHLTSEAYLRTKIGYSSTEFTSLINNYINITYTGCFTLTLISTAIWLNHRWTMWNIVES